MADADLLLGWRNEPATRAASFNSAEISRETHLRWLERVLQDESRALLIVEVGGEALGQIRLDRSKTDPEVAEIHIGLDTAARGRSIGRRALRSAVEQAPDRIGAARVEARVKADNVASLRAFEAAGFRAVRSNDDVVELVAEP